MADRPQSGFDPRDMSTLLCMRRGGVRPVRRYHPDVDPLVLWYVDGFAVVREGHLVGIVELVLPTVDGDLPGSLVVRTPAGGAILDATDVERVRFGDREVVTTAEPVAFELPDPDVFGVPRDLWPASA
jgi:hypothetical protein